MKNRILAIVIFAMSCSTVLSQTQFKIDSVQTSKIDNLEKQLKPIEDLKTNILLWIGGFTLLFGGLTLWNVFKQTKDLVKSKQAEVIKNATDEMLKNLSVQLGMPLEQVKRILENADKGRLIRSKNLLVLNIDGEPRLGIQQELEAKGFTKPKFKKWDSKPSLEGFDVLIIDSLDDALYKEIPNLVKGMDDKIQFVVASKTRLDDFDTRQFKSKIQFANSDARVESAISALFN